MALLFWDASALAKRYTAEAGRETVNALFTQSPPHILATTPWGYVETYSILWRRLNDSTLDAAAWAAAVAALQAEVVSAPDFRLQSVSDTAVFASVSLITRHSLNATDAAILTVLLDYARSPGAPVCVLIAADKRLVRAAAAEGLKTLNPEHVPAADVSALLAAL